jgi:hypothetical protein
LSDLRELAERYVRSVKSRNRFSHRYGLELAEAVLGATAGAEGGASDRGAKPEVA